jgi:hypothetical protein
VRLAGRPPDKTKTRLPASTFEESAMSGKTSDHLCPVHTCAGIGRAAARIQLAVAGWRGGREGEAR